MIDLAEINDLKLSTPLEGIIQTGEFGNLPATVSLNEKVAQLVHLSPYRGQAASLQQRLQQRFSLGLPATGKWQDNPAETGIRIFWSGLNQWMLQLEDKEELQLYSECLQNFSEISSVVDQGHSRCIVRISGKNAAAVLQRHTQIDLRPQKFKSKDCAALQFSHLSAHLLRLQDDAEGDPAFELQVFRSYAEYLWKMLTHSAAQFGYQVR